MDNIRFGKCRCAVHAIVLFFFMFMCIIDPVYGQDKEATNTIVYDTVYVYDTVLVYDTIWVYDTIYFNIATNARETITALAPIKLGYLLEGLSPISMGPLLIISFDEEPTKKQKQNTSNHRPLYHLKIKIKPKKLFNPGIQRLTLNPSKGHFNPKLLLKGELSINGNLGTSYQNTQYSFSSGTGNNDSIENAFKSLTGWQYGVNVEYNLFQVSLMTGLQLVQQRAQFNAIANEYAYIDTTYFNELLGTVVTDTDSSLVYNSAGTINKYHLLEIPVVFSYHWMLSRSRFSIQMGEINQLYLYSKGLGFTNYHQVNQVDKAMGFTKYNIALFTGMAYTYDISNRLDIEVDAYYKHPLKKFATGFNMSVYQQSYGFNVALKYSLVK